MSGSAASTTRQAPAAGTVAGPGAGTVAGPGAGPARHVVLVPAPAPGRGAGPGVGPGVGPARGRRVALAPALALTAWLAAACTEEAALPATAAAYVGSASCAACHGKQQQDWHGSHHDLAMQRATAETVLGDFENSTFDHFGVVSRFYRKDGRFMVRTDGPDGRLADFEIAYTFGVYPLQQYLVKFPRGRVQVLGICWDSRPKERGGQRWFHVYDEKITHDDPLHWTGRAQNWNFMCANCHSTDLRKNYDVATDTYATTWSEIDVSCEACHGPASHHVAWARAEDRPNYAHAGFPGSLHDDATWTIGEGARTAARTGGANARAVTETCARCHSRRSTMTEDHVHGRLLDTQRPALLEPHLYHADGQIEDEVYVYGSFAQSRMFHEGVTCTDCHEPHTLRRLAPGNALCVRCHDATAFDTAEHHHHEAGTTAASCTACHMPVEYYMVVDARLDHSIRVPRPDLSARLGTPNACNGCHGDRDAAWAATTIRGWRGPDYRPAPHFATVLHDARRGVPGVAARLAALATDPTVPAIARATAFSHLGERADAAALPAIRRGLADGDPLVRFGAVGALAALDAGSEEQLQLRFDLGAALVSDPVRAVRLEAARILAPLPRDRWPAETRPAFDAALREYEAFQLLNGDQPWAHDNLGIVRFQQHRFREAEASFRTALRLDPKYVRAYVNLADLYRDLGREDDCEKTLRAGIDQVVDAAELHHALGLLLVRERKNDAALAALGRAARMRPDVARFAYAYALALHAADRFEAAMSVLRDAHRRVPGDYDIVYALATFHREKGMRAEAARWARALVEIAPRDETARALLRDLEH